MCAASLSRWAVRAVYTFDPGSGGPGGGLIERLARPLRVDATAFVLRFAVRGDRIRVERAAGVDPEEWDDAELEDDDPEHEESWMAEYSADDDGEDEDGEDQGGGEEVAEEPGFALLIVATAAEGRR